MQLPDVLTGDWLDVFTEGTTFGFDSANEICFHFPLKNKGPVKKKAYTFFEVFEPPYLTPYLPQFRFVLILVILRSIFNREDNLKEKQAYKKI